MKPYAIVLASLPLCASAAAPYVYPHLHEEKVHVRRVVSIARARGVHKWIDEKEALHRSETPTSVLFPRTKQATRPAVDPIQGLVRELSSDWGSNATPSAKLVVKELERHKASGDEERIHGRGTIVTYSFETSGFPTAKRYVLFMRQSGDWTVLPILGGYQADDAGRIICPLVSGTSGANAASNSMTPAQCSQPIAEQKLGISHYHKGEPLEAAILSTDGTVRAFGKAYPFPIQGQDGQCTLTVELEKQTGTEFMVYGEGFEPNEDVKGTLNAGKKDVWGITRHTSSLGSFDAPVFFRGSGKATFAASGSSCHPHVSFDWGKKAMEVQ